MPKIWGNVRIGDTQGELTCFKCGYKWHSKVDWEKIVYKHNKVTCPLCRALKEQYKPGDFVDNKYMFRIPNDILKIPHQELTNGSISDIKIPIFSMECRHRFYISLIDLPRFEDVPYCRTCAAMRKAVDDNAKKAEQIRETETKFMPSKTRFESGKTLTTKVEATDQKSQYQEQKPNSIENQIRASKTVMSPTIKPMNIDLNTNLDIDPETIEKMRQNFLANGHKRIKAENIRKNEKKYNELINSLQNNLGKSMTGGARLISINAETDEMRYQCLRCGSEYTGQISKIIAAEGPERSEMLACSKCKKLLDATGGSISDLTSHYIGKIYNGLIIRKIYLQNGEALCDVECLRSRKVEKFVNDNGVDRSVETPGHEYKGINLGSIINRQCVCEKCGNENLLKNSSFVSSIPCKFRNKLTQFGYNSYSGYGYGTKKEDFILTRKELYTSDKYLCDVCPYLKECPEAHSFKTSTKYLSSKRDSDASIDRSMTDVAIDFPSIYSNATSEMRKLVSIDFERGLIKFREAYVGNDGQLYSFCKCHEHNTLMILSQSEINEFCHKQCTEEYNKYMNFYDIDLKYLLTNPGAEKDKR